MDAKTVPLWLVLVDAIWLSGGTNHFGRQACAGSSTHRFQFSRGPVQRSGIDWAIRAKAGVALAAPRFLPLSEERVVRGCPRLAWTSGRCRRRCCICSVWKRARLYTFALFWIGLTIAPALNARWMTATVFAERYLYLPSVGFSWLVSGVLFWFRRSAGAWKHGLRVAVPAASVRVAFLATRDILHRTRDS